MAGQNNWTDPDNEIFHLLEAQAMDEASLHTRTEKEFCILSHFLPHLRHPT